MNNLTTDEPDIIQETPEKEKVRKPGKKKHKSSTATTSVTNYHSVEDYIITLSLRKVPNQSIYATKVGTTDYNKPYVYYSIDELLQLSKKYVPKHNNILLVGKYMFHNTEGSHYLTYERERKVYCKIKLDFKLITNTPDPGSILSLYGSLEHVESSQGLMVPIFMARFFRYESQGFLNKYKESLRFVRNFVPLCYLELLSIR